MLVLIPLLRQLRNLRKLYKILFLFFLLLQKETLFAKAPRHVIIDSPGYIGGAGFFHNFNIVLGFLDLYDKTPDLSIEVNFWQRGLYYEKGRGDNWWSYYFLDTKYERKNLLKPIIRRPSDIEKAEMGNSVHFYMTRQRASFLIEKYIRVKPEILQEVEDFYTTYLKGHRVIGLHYRATDKVLEANAISYQEVKEKLLKEIEKQKADRIFVATDDPIFLLELKQDFSSLVVHTDAQRIENAPIHYTSDLNYLKGKEALIDCLLLARSDVLLRCSSNLSAVSCFFNPNMKAISLNYLLDDLYTGINKKGLMNELNIRP